jgi:hypothetical protein
MNIYNNDIAIGPEWTTIPGTGAVYHHNGIFSWAQSDDPGAATNVNIYNNYIHGPTVLPDGYDVNTANLGTGFIFLQFLYITDLKIYNNVMAGITDDIGSGNIYMEYCRILDPEIYNNTMIGLGNANGCIALVNYTDTTLKAKNNICVGVVKGIWLSTKTGYTPTISLEADNNLYYNVGKVGAVSTTTYTTLSAWQTKWGGCPGAGRECKSLTSNPDLNTNFIPKATSAVKGTGTATGQLSATDKVGVTWLSPPSMGAYEYIRPPLPPRNLRIK